MEPVRERLAELAPGAELLENLRFDPGEEGNDPAFVARLVEGIDAYVDDAFGPPIEPTPRSSVRPDAAVRGRAPARSRGRGPSRVCVRGPGDPSWPSSAAPRSATSSA